MIKIDIGKIKKELRRRNMSILKFAKEMRKYGYEQRNIYKFFQGHNSNYKLCFLICEYLKLDINEIYKIEGDK